MRLSFWLVVIFVVLVRLLTSFPSYNDGQRLRISGTLYSEPTNRGGAMYINVLGINVVAKNAPEVHYGDFVVVDGIWQTGRMVNATFEQIGVSENIFVRLRRRVTDFYKNNLSEPMASLVSGITMGAKSELSTNFSSKLKNSGTSHIVVASGTNVMVVANFVLSCLILVIKRQKAVLVSIVFIWIYTLITGFEAPVVRASIMASFVFLAQSLGRVINVLRVTFLTFLAMLFIVPSWIGDVGFWLSFSTTLSLVLFQPAIDKFLKFLPGVFRENFSTTISAQVGSLPIVSLFFGKVNLFSAIFNVLILWTVMPIMLIGSVSGILSLVFPDLARFVLDLSRPFLAWFVTVVSF